jgi:MtaA/CmuA family methyltransferase
MPITMMYASDQIGKSYRDYVTDFRVLVEAQIATAEKFRFDYVSCISDPAREAADCGAKVSFYDDQPPAIDETDALLSDKSRLGSLEIPAIFSAGRMEDRVRAAELFREKVGGETLIEGWVEGPCAEGSDLRGINALMLDFFDDTTFVRELFEFAVELALEFARAQIEAGVDLVGIGDAAASLVGPQIYDEFVFPWEHKLIKGIHDLGAPVRLHICGDTRGILERMGELGADIVDLDFMVPMGEARDAMGDKQVLLGNLDPVLVLLKGSVQEVIQGLQECLDRAGPRYIVGAGCEVPRGTPEENLLALSQFARSCVSH